MQKKKPSMKRKQKKTSKDLKRRCKSLIELVILLRLKQAFIAQRWDLRQQNDQRAQI